MAKAGDADIRISDAEREAAIATLGEHLSTGRLELPEYEERCDRVTVARTRGELEALFRDLPLPHPDLSSATAPRQRDLVRLPSKKKKEMVHTPESRRYDALANICLFVGMPTAVLLTVFLGFWWLFIPFGIGLFGFAAAADEAKKPKP